MPVISKPIPPTADLPGARDPDGNLQPLTIDDFGNLQTTPGPGAAAVNVNVVNTSLTPVPVTISPTALTPSAPASASVGVTSAQAVAANASRRGLALINVSANRISFGLGAAAVLDGGITLMPSGGVWEMDETTFTTAAINAIASGGASTLSIQEFT